MVSATILVNLAVFATVSIAAPLSDASLAASPIPGYAINDIEWMARAAATGPAISVNGTIQDVVARLTEIYPPYEAWLQDAISQDQLGEPYLLDKRYMVKAYTCKMPMSDRPTETKRVREGVQYLRRVEGKPQRGPGPKSCGRVSCSWNAAIYWCNDSTSFKELDSYTAIADAAEMLINKCDKNPYRSASEDGKIHGTVSFADDWSVYVKHEGC